MQSILCNFALVYRAGGYSLFIKKRYEIKMMKLLKKDEAVKLIKKRHGEKKLGEQAKFLNGSAAADLRDAPGKYVVFGIPEDIGVRANLGVPGASRSWIPFLKVFLNVQSNRFLSGDEIIVAGELDLSQIQESTNDQALVEELRRITAQIDEAVAEWVYAVKKAGKIPIAIGGGHNNAYGLLKGCSQAAEKPLNTVNCDPHSDFRTLEGRHSGNGFSYAYNRKYLKKYAVIALHEGYNSEDNLISMEITRPDLHFSFFEDIAIRQTLSLERAFEDAYLHVAGNYGIELDLDAVKNMPVSALTPSGITPENARQYIHFFASRSIPEYLHICEAAPENLPQPASLTGKLLSYLTCDFIKAVNAQL